MARNKNLLMKEIKSDLDQAQHILTTVESVETITFEEAKAAASLATQAATNLHRLAGMLDVEQNK